MLAHPPNPKPTTSTHTTTKAFITYMAVQLGIKGGGFSAAFCKRKPMSNKLASGEVRPARFVDECFPFFSRQKYATSAYN
jgi:hypothetical protein